MAITTITVCVISENNTQVSLQVRTACSGKLIEADSILKIKIKSSIMKIAPQNSEHSC